MISEVISARIWMMLTLAYIYIVRNNVHSTSYYIITQPPKNSHVEKKSAMDRSSSRPARWITACRWAREVVTSVLSNREGELAAEMGIE